MKNKTLTQLTKRMVMDRRGDQKGPRQSRRGHPRHHIIHPQTPVPMGSWWPWRTRTKDDWCHGDVTTFNVSRNETKVNTWVVCLYASALPLCRSWVDVFPRAVIERLSGVQFFLMIGKVQCRIVFPKIVMTTVYLRSVDNITLYTKTSATQASAYYREISTMPCFQPMRQLEPYLI